MSADDSISEKRLVDLLVRRLPNGYLEVVAITDAGTFNILRNEIARRPSDNKAATPGFNSSLDKAYRNTLIRAAWSDGDSLLIILENDRGIVYEFVPPDAMGSSEALRFIANAAELADIQRFIEADPDARLL